jgi:hypothetical protein
LDALFLLGLVFSGLTGPGTLVLALFGDGEPFEAHSLVFLVECDKYKNSIVRWNRLFPLKKRFEIPFYGLRIGQQFNLLQKL